MIILYNKLGNVELLYDSAHKLSLWEICKNTSMTEAIYANAGHKTILACISILWNVSLILTSCNKDRVKRYIAAGLLTTVRRRETI